MMKCINLRSREVYNPVTHSMRVVHYPCGKCTACLHNHQDSWRIRLLETCNFYGSFVYDTLTFRQSSMPMVDITDFYEEVKLHKDAISPQSVKLIERYSRGYYGWQVPYVERSIIRDWIRNARELFVYDHGYRPKWKYMVTLEYGPKYSRPHFHLMFFGISKADYRKYLGKVWEEKYGFTKFNFIIGDDRADASRISRYISKYISKGSWDSPLVLDGILPKPFRSISHGIGSEYLRHSKFDVFRTSVAKFLKSIKSNIKLNNDSRTAYPRLAIDGGVLQKTDFSLTEANIKALSVYYDDGGYPHALPRYYKSKILNLHTPNVLSYAVQNYIYAHIDMQHNKALARFAYSMGYRNVNEKAPDLGLHFSDFNLLSDKYNAICHLQAQACIERCQIKLNNFYKRPLNHPSDRVRALIT